jgi:predicted signal transduction protein with EAL and GGDEF domain
VQLREEGFARGLRTLLAGIGMPPTRLQLELTEGTVMEDPGRAARVLGELSAMGVRIALDDFGTGHSSLAYLRTFPIHCIKIDRAFVLDIGGDGRDAAIVPAIVAIARSLGAEVVAEGVETVAQRQALVTIGCRVMQGYLFSRPLPAAESGSCDAHSRECRGTPASRKAIWSARILRFARMKASCRLGTYGTYSSGIPAASGVRLPLRWLQTRQADTTFCQIERPPRELGMTCSISSVFWPKRPPQ